MVVPCICYIGMTHFDLQLGIDFIHLGLKSAEVLYTLGNWDLEKVFFFSFLGRHDFVVIIRPLEICFRSEMWCEMRWQNG